MRYEKLGDLCKISSGGTPSRNKAEYFTNGEIPWVKTGDLGKKYVTEPLEKISRLGLENSSAKIFPRHTVLVAMYGATIGSCAILNFEACTNQACAAFLPTDTVNSEYLYYFLRSIKQSLIGMGKGGGQPNISAGLLKEVEIPLPSIDDQVRIAHLLGKVEGLITQRKQHLQQLDDLLKSVFLEMFGDPVRNEKGWDTKALPELCLKITDGEHLNPKFSPSGMPMIMAGNVLDHTVSFRDTKFVEYGLGEGFRKKCNPEMSDVLLVSRGATIGRLCKVDTSEPFCLMGSVILLKPVHEAVSSTFLVAQLKHPALYWKLFRSSGSSAQQAIYLKDVKRLVCILPPKELQLKFSKLSEKVESTKDSYRRSLAELEALYGALSQQAFKGLLDLSKVQLIDEDPKETSEDIFLSRQAESFPEDEYADIDNLIRETNITPPNILIDMLGVSELWLDAYINYARNKNKMLDMKLFMQACTEKWGEMQGFGSTSTAIGSYDKIKNRLFEKLHNEEVVQKYDEGKLAVSLKFSKQGI